MKTKVSFTREPYYAHLLISFDELLQSTRPQSDFEGCSAGSIEDYTTILDELSAVNVLILSDESIDEKHRDLIEKILSRMLTAAQPSPAPDAVPAENPASLHEQEIE